LPHARQWRPFAVIAVDLPPGARASLSCCGRGRGCFRALDRRTSAALGIDPERLAIGGDSAGANLATVVSLLARDRGPALAAQMLFYPVTDLGRLHPSYDEFVEGFPVTRATMLWFRDLYLRSEADATIGAPRHCVRRISAGCRPPS